MRKIITLCFSLMVLNGCMPAFAQEVKKDSTFFTSTQVVVQTKPNFFQRSITIPVTHAVSWIVQPFKLKPIVPQQSCVVINQKFLWADEEALSKSIHNQIQCIKLQTFIYDVGLRFQ
jgi:PBP1b-binding outer membrane lipoprotein LpoB